MTAPGASEVNKDGDDASEMAKDDENTNFEAAKGPGIRTESERDPKIPRLRLSAHK